ncbi:F-box protein SKP2A-like [Bidens hawaiensis]|uniref:F-box protein SKP2A-like n=1 Tax=Bidens hawaiensis TaxID=980011 RepID=UPI0040499F58
MKGGELEVCFERLMMAGGGRMGGRRVVIDWSEIPAELLLRVVSLLDDRTVIVASAVCCGWRDAICWGLTHISLSWCKNSMNNLVLSLAPKLKNLRSLTLRQDKPQLFDNAVETIANNCHGLEDLDLSKSFKLSDQSLYALAHGCQNLIKLTISGCSSFSDNALAYLSSYCKKLKILNLCGCVKAASDKALKTIGYNCSQLQSLNLGWCEEVGDDGVTSLAYGCHDLRALDLCGCVLITDESVIALANNCPHLRSLGLYYCQNITDQAIYALAHSRAKNKHQVWGSVKTRDEEGSGLMNLNISQCTALTPPAVQALCDSFPALHTCPGRHSLIISGCLNLTSVHCACALQAHRAVNTLTNHAY